MSIAIFKNAEANAFYIFYLCVGNLDGQKVFKANYSE